MNKYKIFKNKRTKYHPSIEINVLEDGTWENIEITDSPTVTGNYGEFDVNPNPNSDKKSYFRKYIRKDKLRHRGLELKKYRLVVSDEIKIDVYVSLIKKQRKNGGKLTNEALTQKGRSPSPVLNQNIKRKARKMDNQRSFTCPVCGNTDIHSIGILNGKPYCRRCISFRGEEVEHKPSYPKKAPIHLEYELSPEQKELSDKLVENYKKGIDSLVFAVCGSPKTRKP